MRPKHDATQPQRDEPIPSGTPSGVFESERALAAVVADSGGASARCSRRTRALGRKRSESEFAESVAHAPGDVFEFL